MRHRLILSLACLLALVPASLTLAQRAEDSGPFDFPREWFYRGDEDEMWSKMTAAVGKSVDVLDFKVRDWSGLDPDEAALSPKALSGRVLVLNFWRTDDKLSLSAIPHFNMLYTEFKDEGVEVIGITAERGSELATQVIEAEGIRYVTGRDTFRATSRSFGLEWHPWTVVIDRNGIVRAAGLRPEHIRDAVQLVIDAQPAKREYTPKTLRFSESSSDEDGDSIDAPSLAPTVEPIPKDWIEAGFDRMLVLEPLTGKRPPVLEVEDWRNSFPLKLRERRGEVILLFFFVVDHPPSTKIAKALNNYYIEKKDEGLTVIGIADTVKSEDLTRFMSENNFEFRVAKDINRSTINRYQVDTYPDFYFIDRRGILRAADVKASRIDDVTELLLKETP